MNLKISFVIAALCALGAGNLYASNCPPAPAAITDIGADVISSVEGSAGKLANVKLIDLSVKTKVEMKSLYENYPNLDKITVLQMLSAEYCNRLNNTDIPDTEKLEHWEKFQNQIMENYVAPKQTQNTQNIKNIENIKNVEHIKNIENIRHIENIRNIQNTTTKETTDHQTKHSVTQLSADSILDIKFGIPFEQLNANALITTPHSQYLKYSQDFLGSKFEVLQLLQNGKTSRARLWQSIDGSYSGSRREGKGPDRAYTKTLCSIDKFNRTVGEISKKYGAPNGSQNGADYKEAQRLGTTYSYVSRGSYWKVKDGSMLLLLMKDYEYVTHYTLAAKNHQDTMWGCRTQLCAIPPNYKSMCFEIPELTIPL